MNRINYYSKVKRLEGKWIVLLGMILFIGIGVTGFSSLQAATFCVNPGATNGCYALPSLAVAAAANGDTILVRSGTYNEPGAINITKLGLKIIGDNPINTIVKNSAYDVIVISSTGDNAEIANLTITGGGNGIVLQSGAVNIQIHHNHIQFNGASGIVIGGYNSTSYAAFNNIIRSNINGHGIYASGSNDVTIYNNIIADNNLFGIVSGTSVSYNSVFNNKSGPFSGSPVTVTAPGTNILVDCLFVDKNAFDYRLQAGSPCINAGNPAYLDPDGTRSDMGSFGGEASAMFWPYGGGKGPVVTNLTVDPPIVPEGGTLSIKATIEVR